MSSPVLPLEESHIPVMLVKAVPKPSKFHYQAEE
jgi:hypothetical protein